MERVLQSPSQADWPDLPSDNPLVETLRLDAAGIRAVREFFELLDRWDQEESNRGNGNSY